MALETLKFTLTGTRPLLMNNVQSADTQSDTSKAKKLLTAKKTKKTDEDVAEIDRLDWRNKLYLSADGEERIIIPQRNLKALIVSGAKKFRSGTDAKEAVFFEEPEFELKFDGPKNLDELYSTPGSVFRTIVVVPSSKARVASVRPRFKTGWSVTAEVTVDTEVADIETVKNWLLRAQNIGLGDWHYEFGAFRVTF